MQSKCVKDLGAGLDSHMELIAHINAVSRSFYAQLRQIGHINQYLTPGATKTLVNSLVTSKPDYWNSLIHGTCKNVLQKLQTVQNTAARIITRTSRYSHVTPVLKELYWLPVQNRIEFKIPTLTYKALQDQSPKYITDMLDVYRPRTELRSANQSVTLVVPRCRLVKYGDRSFMYAAPKLWNALSADARDAKTLASLKKCLKTHIFQNAYQ